MVIVVREEDSFQCMLVITISEGDVLLRHFSE